MVGKKTLKVNDFETIQDYYKYILDSVENGQKDQAKQFFKKLSIHQKVEFYQFIDVFYHYDKEENENPVLEFIKILNL